MKITEKHLCLLENITVDNIDPSDAPDFSDAYIEYAEIGGVPLTQEELDEVNNFSDFIHDQVFNQLY